MELSNPLISDYTWANKPSVAPNGQIICVTDIGENGSLWRGNGTKWVRLSQILFYDLTAAFAITGTTLETTLVTLTIPAGLIGSNGKVKLYPLWSVTNNANNKTVRVKLGGSTGYFLQSSGYAQLSNLVIFRNFNSESVQKVSSGMSSGLGSTTGAFTSLAIDTSAATTLTITGQLQVGTDTMTLEGLFVEIV